MDSRISRGRSPDEIVEGDLIGPGDGEQEFQVGPALA
jgi:hypothetical protein